MRKSCATVSFSGLLEAKLSAIAKAGFSGVEILISDIEAFSGSPAVVRKICDDLDLRIEIYQPLRDFEGVSDAEFETKIEQTKHIFETMNELGTNLILLCSNTSSETDGCIKRNIDQLRRLADTAQRYQKQVGYEALSWGTYINRAQQAWHVVEQVNHSAFGLVLDSFHMFAIGESPQFIRNLPADRVFFVQIADAPILKTDLRSWSRHHRCLPGRGDFDLIAFMSNLTACGYDGPISLEVFSDELKLKPPRDVARLAGC
jgi:4-hydroxyphenylpyruvate dioxygenase